MIISEFHTTNKKQIKNERMKKSILILFVLYLSLISVELFAQTVDQQIILTEINKIRKTGCKCGNKYYPAVKPLVWNDTLLASAWLKPIKK